MSNILDSANPPATTSVALIRENGEEEDIEDDESEEHGCSDCGGETSNGGNDKDENDEIRNNARSEDDGPTGYNEIAVRGASRYHDVSLLVARSGQWKVQLKPLMACRLTTTIDATETIRSWRPRMLADREDEAHDDRRSALMLLRNERHESRMEFTSSKWLGSR